MSARPQSGEDGFALAEVLVGFAILALASLGMMRAFGGTLETLRAVTLGEARLDLAERLLAERRAARRPEASLSEGVEDGLAWSTRVEAVEESPAGGERLWRVVVSVGRRGETAPEPMLTTLMLGDGE